MDLRETRVFINPDLLQSAAGFDALKKYFSTTTPEDLTMVSDLVDGELVVKPALGNLVTISSPHIIADLYAIRGGYWKMSVESIREFLGIE